MKIDAPGIYSGVPMDAYLADPCPAPSLSSGLAHTMLTRSPRHVWTEHCRLNPNYRPEEKAAFDLGTAAHEALLEGIDTCCVIEAKDWRTNAAKDARDAAHADGRIPLLRKDYEPLAAMVEVAKAFIETTDFAGIFDDGEPEATIIWTEGPLWLRARPDWLSGPRMLHYKTSGGSARPESFSRGQLVTMGYDRAVAFYERGLNAVMPAVHPESRILVQEIEAPYGCSLIALDNEKHAIASADIARAIKLWGKCMASGKWPAYPSTTFYAEPTYLQIKDAEENNYRESIDPRQEEEGLQV